MVDCQGILHVPEMVSVHSQLAMYTVQEFAPLKSPATLIGASIITMGGLENEKNSTSNPPDIEVSPGSHLIVAIVKLSPGVLTDSVVLMYILVAFSGVIPGGPCIP